MLWVCIGGGMLSLLIAAIGKRTGKTVLIISSQLKDQRRNFL